MENVPPKEKWTASSSCHAKLKTLMY